jgi:hypothetical protein
MPWCRLDLRDAIVAVYLGEVELPQISKQFGGVSRRHVTQLVSQMPPGLRNGAERLQVTRMANELAKHEMYQCYTDWELQTALLDYSTATKTLSVCSAEYGVPSSTLRSKRKAVDQAIGRTPSVKAAKAFVATLHKQIPGPCVFISRVPWLIRVQETAV